MPSDLHMRMIRGCRWQKGLAGAQRLPSRQGKWLESCVVIQGLEQGWGRCGSRSEFQSMNLRFEMPLGDPGSDVQGAFGCCMHTHQLDMSINMLAVLEVLGKRF